MYLIPIFWGYRFRSDKSELKIGLPVLYSEFLITFRIYSKINRLGYLLIEVIHQRFVSPMLIRFDYSDRPRSSAHDVVGFWPNNSSLLISPSSFLLNVYNRREKHRSTVNTFGFKYRPRLCTCLSRNNSVKSILNDLWLLYFFYLRFFYKKYEFVINTMIIGCSTCCQYQF